MAIHKLTAKQVMTLLDGVYSDGNGLYLFVGNNGMHRSWRYLRTKDGRKFYVGLGPVRLLSLVAARKLVERINDALSKGIHPRAYLQSLIPTRQKEEKKPSLNDVFEKAMCDIAKVKRWHTPATEATWRRVARMYTLPVIGNIPLDKITHNEVLKVLKPIWETKHTTALVVILSLSAFLDWAEIHGYRTGENPAKWNGKLALALFQPARGWEKKHFKAIGVEEIPLLCKDFWHKDALGYKAVLFGILTATRISEFRQAKWEEFDFGNRIWTIPSTRRKDGKPFPHRVPLSNETLALLKQLSNKTVYLFPGRTGTFMHHKTPIHALQREGYNVTMHGMRSTFRDWAAITHQNVYASEIALSHKFGPHTTMSYLRTDMLDERRVIMQRWADHCFKLVNK